MIDWTDKRAIGLKCWFSFSDIKSVLRDVHSVDAGMTTWINAHDGISVPAENCRIAQGENTSYDGKTQPVPDGVMVTVTWLDFNTTTNYSQLIDWYVGIIDYQVQESVMK